MTLEQWLTRDLQNLYQAENEQAHALRRLSQAASSPELRSAFEEHGTETQAQAQRLQQILQSLGSDAGGEGQVPVGVRGLEQEGEATIKLHETSGMKDLALIAAAQKLEHYEISCYGTARAIAHTLGRDQEARLLQDTLMEEERADRRLTQLALALLKQVGQSEPNIDAPPLEKR